MSDGDTSCLREANVNYNPGQASCREHGEEEVRLQADLRNIKVSEEDICQSISQRRVGGNGKDKKHIRASRVDLEVVEEEQS